MKILTLADLHLGRNRGELSCFNTEDCEYAIKQLSDIYSNQKIDFTVLAGDIVNGTSINDEEQHLLALLKNVLNKHQKDKVFLIRGNHDRARYDTMEEMFGFTQLTDRPFKISKYHTISGCNFKDREAHLKYLKENKADILVCHLPMSPFSTFTSDAISASDCPKDKVVIVGDTHKPAIYTAHGGLVISVGCLFPKDKSELLSGYSGYLGLIELDENVAGLDTIGFTQIPLKKRFGADLTSFSNASDLVDGFMLDPAYKGRNRDLMPVLYVRNSIYQALIDEDLLSDFKIFGVPYCDESDQQELQTTDVDSEDTLDAIKKIVENLFSDDPKKVEIVELTSNLIITDDSKTVISDFIKNGA